MACSSVKEVIPRTIAGQHGRQDSAGFARLWRFSYASAVRPRLFSATRRPLEVWEQMSAIFLKQANASAHGRAYRASRATICWALRYSSAALSTMRQPRDVLITRTMNAALSDIFAPNSALGEYRHPKQPHLIGSVPHRCDRTEQAGRSVGIRKPCPSPSQWREPSLWMVRRLSIGLGEARGPVTQSPAPSPSPPSYCASAPPDRNPPSLRAMPVGCNDERTAHSQKCDRECLRLHKAQRWRRAEQSALHFGVGDQRERTQSLC